MYSCLCKSVSHNLRKAPGLYTAADNDIRKYRPLHRCIEPAPADHVSDALLSGVLQAAPEISKL